MIARPALRKSQEWPDAREVAIPEADGEVIVYEWVKLTGDQPGVMPTKSVFAHLEDQDLEEPTPSPYTLAVRGRRRHAEQVALFPESQIKYEPLGNRVFPTPEKPYGELVEPDVVAIATRASDDLEKLAARVAKANKPKPKD